MGLIAKLGGSTPSLTNRQMSQYKISNVTVIRYNVVINASGWLFYVSTCRISLMHSITTSCIVLFRDSFCDSSKDLI